MAKSGTLSRYVCVLIVGITVSIARDAAAADLYVSTPAELQAALNMAQGGDTVLLAAGTYTGNFKLPVHGGSGFVTVRTADPQNALPGPGSRITPNASPRLARLQSPNSTATIRTAAGAAYWRLELLEVGPGPVTTTTLIELGDGSATQNLASQIPHHLVVDRLYVHGDPLAGQKRAFGLNSADTTITNSYVAEIKAVGLDAQALAGWNGPGPYTITNNYFEAAGTAVLFGGDDPKVLDLVPSEIVFRDNTVTRPESWREAILATPSGARASFVPGGTLAAGTYGYRVVARRMIGSTAVKSAATGEVTVTVAAGSTALVQWNPIPDASDYLVYGRTAGAPNRYWVVKGTSFSDDGVVASASGAPSAATVWQTKNLFELKNARNVQIEHNLLANNWAQAQSGTAVLFTPRNQGGRCNWCVVENVTFENNILRGVGGGFQLTGWDNLHPSLQGNNITIRHNLIVDLSKSWGGKAYLVTITDSPRDVTIDHNTVISPDGSGLVLAGGDPITGLVFTNNVARHNTYGIFGSGSAIGLKSLARYFPGSSVTRNVLAGGAASAYPSGNEFPNIATFEAHFVDYAGGDYALVPDTDWQGAGTDGKDLGADRALWLGAGEAGPSVQGPRPHVPPLEFAATVLPDTTEGDIYATPALAATGGVEPYSWSISAGQLPPGIYFDSVMAAFTGSATVAGDYSVTIQVTDARGISAAQTLTVHVNRAIPPVTILTGALDTITSTVPSAQALSASGGLGTYSWSVVGTLPLGLSLSPSGVLSGMTRAMGSYSVMVTATDTEDNRRFASQQYSLYVAPPPNHPPTVSMSGPSSSVLMPVGATVVFSGSAFDVDENLTRIDVYRGATLLASFPGPSFAVQALLPEAGEHQFRAIATDARGETAESATFTVATQPEIVLHASDVKKIVGNYQLVADPTAAGGKALWSVELGAAKLANAAAAPASYAEFTFYAEAGRPYHLWIRGRAHKNSWANDSAYVQFSGVAAARIGSSNGLWYNLETATNAGVAGWGWEDNGWGAGVMGLPVVFETTGLQTLRLQPREDGLSIDQIVLSPDRFLTQAPGGSKNDATVLAR